MADSKPSDLYNIPQALDRLGKQPQIQIFVAPHQRATDQLRTIPKPNFVTAVCPSDGTAREVAAHDWSPLYGKRVLVFSDAHEPGRVFAAAIAAHLHSNGSEVRTFLPQADDGAGMGDYAGEGFEAMLQYIESNGGVRAYEEKPDATDFDPGRMESDLARIDIPELGAIHTIEQRVIGAALYGDGIRGADAPKGVVARELAVDHFQDDFHKAIWSAVSKVQGDGEAVEIMAVADKLAGMSARHSDYLVALREHAVGTANLDHYASKLRGGPETKDRDGLVPLGGFAVVDYLWEKWLPKGKVTLLAASGGTGKSTFAGHLAACATNRKPWPDGRVTDPVNVLFIGDDDAVMDTLGPRLKESGADLAGGRVRKSDHGDDYAEVLRKASLCGMVVVDIVEAGMADGRSGSSASDVANHMRQFANMANESGAAVLILLHLNKQVTPRLKEGQSLTDLMRGSGAWADSARMAWLMYRNQSDPYATPVLVRIKTNLGGVRNHGGYRVSAETVTWYDDSGKEGKIDVVSDVVPVDGSPLEIVKAEAMTDTTMEEKPPSKKELCMIEICNVLANSHGGELLQKDLEIEVRRKVEVSHGTFNDSLRELHEIKRRIGKKDAEGQKNAKIVYLIGGDGIEEDE